MCLTNNTVVIIANCGTHAQLVPGPTDITRDEGSNNVPISCPFPAPIWRINSTLYEPLSLKSPLSAIMIGINIDVIDKSFNNTQFQCFLPNGTGLYVHKSTIGTITVTKVGKYSNQLHIIILLQI